MNERAPGFTLVELLVVAVVTSVILAAIFQTMVMQQQSYREEMAVVDSRQTARTALELLANELREVSPTGGDIALATPDSIRFRAYRKIGIVCENMVGSHVVVWELGAPIAVGDSVLVFADGNENVSEDDSWLLGSVNQHSATTCSYPWAGIPAVKVVHNPPLSVSAVKTGAPVRVFEAATYGRYHLDGEWVVGRQKLDRPPEALVGPITADDGLTFRYFDEDGAVLTPNDAATRARIRRIEIVVRSRRVGSVGSQGVVDSLVTQVRLRGSAGTSWN